MSTIKIKAKHAIITPTCQKNRGMLGAWSEALDRVAIEYYELAQLDINKAAKFHLILEVEREVETGNEKLP